LVILEIIFVTLSIKFYFINLLTIFKKHSYLKICEIQKLNKFKRTFQNWSKILKLQKSFTTYKWGIMYMIFFKNYNLLYKKTLKKIKINYWLWFEIVIIFKDETRNLQRIDTFSKLHIYSKVKKYKKIEYHPPKQLYAFFITICKNNNSKIHLYEKFVFGQKDM